MNLNFKDSNILVFGDLMLDAYEYGEVTRISPEAPVPVIKIIKTEYKLGGACNVSSNIITLGGNSNLIGLVGDDNESIILKDLLKKKSIDTALVKSKNFHTIVKKRIVSNNQQLLRIDKEKSINQSDSTELIKIVKENILKYDILVISDYNKGCNYKINDVITFAKKHKKLVIVDPKHHDISIYSGTDYITPNIKELELYIGKWKNKKELETKVYNLMQTYNISNVLLTKSENGLSLFTIEKTILNHYSCKAEKIQVFDVSGAGDSVVAILSLLLSNNTPIPQNLELINKVGGISVSKFGTYSVKIKDIK